MWIDPGHRSTVHGQQEARGLATVPWRFAARLLRSGRAPRLRRPGRDWDQAGRAGAALAKTGAACDRQDAAGHATARTNRFGSPLILSRVHWVRPELVAEVKFLTWTDDNLLRQVVYQGLREDKVAAEGRRTPPHPKPRVTET